MRDDRLSSTYSKTFKEWKINNLSFIIDNKIKDVMLDSSSSSFQYFMQRLYQHMGYKVESVKKPKDVGRPDLKCWNANERFYVEIKRRYDGLRLPQVKWIIKHPEERVIIHYVDNFERPFILEDENIR